jgi:hypothetical protein
VITQIVIALCIFFIGIPIALALLGAVLSLMGTLFEILWLPIAVVFAAFVLYGLFLFATTDIGTARIPATDRDVSSVEEGIEIAKAMGTNRPVVFVDEDGKRLGRCWRKSRGEYAC